ncbi:GTP cyclohydrolase II-domain-containing protein [Crucibulum laeve]|uniref:GTP cyclohydrolase II n=1 Tax=Crucibulum laeve TaxID=68775 RepID=A0A5C3MH08_9AGAR|nr:GTP cyclohydrolase II-domain-containing protein [Crucibulum laeve]
MAWVDVMCAEAEDWVVEVVGAACKLNEQWASDDALLEILSAPLPPTPKSGFARRDAALDPLLIAAAAASGPHVTRNHYHHDFFPGVMLPQSEGSWDWTKWSADSASNRSERRRLTYVSRQAPRRQRLQSTVSENEEGKENDKPRETDPLKTADNLPLSPKKRRPSIVATPSSTILGTRSKSTSTSESFSPTKPVAPLVEVKCMARTRIPTPHGPAFLHIYHNNRDSKEHLAIVIDPAQFSQSSGSIPAPPIRSRSLDAVWNDNETEMDRITRGAYVGRLSPTSQRASDPSMNRPTPENVTDSIPSPLIRVHSECFTGETIGSMRCDCGEQLDEAIRLISQPITVPTPSSLTQSTTIPGRGAVIYLRQEGRGIGLLSKIRAYNLQDMGHDTVTANLMLGHKADERGYEIAGAILRDLGLGSESESGSEGVRVLTNNPDKVEALQHEGVRVVERVPMIPRSWQHRHSQMEAKIAGEEHTALVSAPDGEDKIAGATLIGGNAVYGEDLDKYLRTKVLRMGHMLPLWMDDP